MSVAISGAVLERIPDIASLIRATKLFPHLHGMMRGDRVSHHEPRRHRLGVNRRSRRSDAEIAIGMVERIHSGLVDHVLRRRPAIRSVRTVTQQRRKIGSWSSCFSSSSTHQHGPSENRTGISATTFPARTAAPITLRRSRFDRTHAASLVAYREVAIGLQACNNKTATKCRQGGYGDGMVHPTQ